MSERKFITRQRSMGRSEATPRELALAHALFASSSDANRAGVGRDGTRRELVCELARAASPGGQGIQAMEFIIADRRGYAGGPR